MRDADSPRRTRRSDSLCGLPMLVLCGQRRSRRLGSVRGPGDYVCDPGRSHSRVLVLPDTKNCPARGLQSPVHPAIALEIRIEFWAPVAAVDLWVRGVVRASMPETAVGEHTNAACREHDVWAHREALRRLLGHQLGTAGRGRGEHAARQVQRTCQCYGSSALTDGRRDSMPKSGWTANSRCEPAQHNDGDSGPLESLSGCAPSVLAPAICLASIPRTRDAAYLLAKSPQQRGLQNRNARFDSSVPRFSKARTCGLLHVTDSPLVCLADAKARRSKCGS